MADRFGAAVRALRAGRLVAYPTDTLYGLAALARSSPAVARLAEVKRRPPGLPISVAVSSVEELEELADLSDPARAYARARLPGPYTLLARTRRTSGLAPALLAADGTIGLRVPDHPLARELARRAGPITATSANRHGSPAGTSIARLRSTFKGEVAEYLDGPPRPSGRPSTLVDLTGDAPVERPRRSG